MVDLIVEGGRVVQSDGPVRCLDILVDDGRIAGLVEPGTIGDARHRLDARGLFVLPGGVDPHTHFGITNPKAEDYYTESCAAAAGGITTVINFDRSAESYQQVFPVWLASARAQSVIDFGFHLGLLTEAHLEELAWCVDEAGVTSFKFYMNYRGMEKSKFQSDTLLDDGFLYRIMKRLGAHPAQLRLCIHCENMEITRAMRLEGVEGEGLLRWHRLRPGFCEAETVARSLYFARVTGAAVYFVHQSSRESAALLAREDLTSLNCYAETCPHYLVLTVSADCGTLAKVNPPVRETEDVDALWEGLRNGDIHAVGSDHVPRRLERKRASGDLASVEAGFPGLETSLPLLITEGMRRNVSLQRLVDAWSTTPARIFGLYPRKGTIMPGSDADLVLVDLDNQRPVRASTFPGSSGYSVYEGRILRGWPRVTLVRGTVVYSNGEVKVPPGYGQYLSRPLPSAG